MKKPDIPHDEVRRLAALHALDALDTRAEARFDRLTRIAQHVFGTPIALVSLVDAERQWFKSRQGLDAPQTPRDISFCGHAILGDELFVVPDATADPRFADNPLVTGAPDIRFYAGAPLTVSPGFRIGTLCIIDRRPRQLDDAERQTLRDLADCVQAELERTYLLRAQAELQDKEQRLQHLIALSPGVIYSCRASGDFATTFVNEHVITVLGYKPQAFIENPTFWIDRIHPDDRARVIKDLKILFDTGEHTHEYRFLHADGHYRWLDDRFRPVHDEHGSPKEIVGLWMDITERRRAEEELRQFRTSLDQIKDCVFMFWPDTLRFFYFNRGAMEQVGYSAEELRQMSPLDLKPQLDEASFRAKIAPLLSGEIDSVTFETVHRHKDGHLIPVEVFLQYVAPADEPPRIVNIVRDITERKHDELQLRSAENRLRAIIDTVVDGIVTIDAKGIVRTFNPAAERIFGLAAEAIVGHNVKALMPAPYQAEHDGYLHNYLSTGRRKIIGIGREVVGRRSDGSTFPMELAVSEMEVDGQRMFTGIVRDITERKRDELQLRSADNRLRAIIDTVVDGIVTIDTKGIVHTFNPAAERIFGLAAEAIVGRNVKALMPAPYQAEHDGYLHNYLSTGRRKVIGIGREVVGRRSDGSTFPMELAVSEMEIDGQRMFTGIVRDITERKKMERLKSEFVSTVSHELRTPLTSIRGALGLVLGKAAAGIPDRTRQLLETANRNAERLTLLINDILDLEKVESGRLEMEFKPLDLVVLVQHALAANEGYAERHQVRLRLIEVPEQANIRGDEHRLLQVFANLLSNAIKYSPADGEVTVSISRQDDRFRIAVRDHGRGIPAAFRSRIFQRFAQADSSDTREKGGTGLGLSITKAIVDRHGGSIDYVSEEGHGTEFFFELPAWQEPRSEAVTDGRPVLLLCEDNADVALVLSQLLAEERMACDIAVDAASAKHMLASRPYHALLLDLSLPDMDGLALIRELRENETTRQLPIIVVSGLAAEGRAAWKGDALAVVDWLQKPVDQARLAQALRQVLGRSGRPRILHVEDDPDVIQVIQALVEDVGDYAFATTLAGARAQLSRTPVDLVLLDLSLPDGSGLELLNELEGKTPVVVFSGQEASAMLSQQVAAALTKSKTSNEQFLATIRQVIAGIGRSS